MPTRPPRICATHRCQEAQCSAEHKTLKAKRTDERRGSRQSRGYGRRWELITADFRARFPFCGMRADGESYAAHSRCVQQGHTTKLAQCTDHIIAKRDGGTDDESNLQALCLSCNTWKANVFEGGFGRHRRTTGGWVGLTPEGA